MTCPIRLYPLQTCSESRSDRGVSQRVWRKEWEEGWKERKWRRDSYNLGLVAKLLLISRASPWHRSCISPSGVDSPGEHWLSSDTAFKTKQDDSTGYDKELRETHAWFSPLSLFWVIPLFLDGYKFRLFCSWYMALLKKRELFFFLRVKSCFNTF